MCKWETCKSSFTVLLLQMLHWPTLILSVTCQICTSSGIVFGLLAETQDFKIPKRRIHISNHMTVVASCVHMCDEIGRKWHP